MDVLHNFDIEWQLLLAQIINFLIIFYLLKRFLYKPIFAVLKKRADAIKEGIEKAEEGKKALDQALLKEKKIIKEAQDTARKIIADAREQSTTLAKEIEDRAKKQTDRMIEEAKVQIAREAKSAEQQLNKHVAELSIEMLKKSLGSVFGEKEQSEVVSKAVKTLQKSN